MVQSAAQSVGSVLGNRLAKKLGGKMGFVDEVGVEQNTDLGGSAFTVGKYLSPRLFVSYGVGLFEPGNAITVRYAVLGTLVTGSERHAGRSTRRRALSHREVARSGYCVRTSMATASTYSTSTWSPFLSLAMKFCPSGLSTGRVREVPSGRLKVTVLALVSTFSITTVACVAVPALAPGLVPGFAVVVTSSWSTFFDKRRALGLQFGCNAAVITDHYLVADADLGKVFDFGAYHEAGGRPVIALHGQHAGGLIDLFDRRADFFDFLPLHGWRRPGGRGRGSRWSRIRAGAVSAAGAAAVWAAACSGAAAVPARSDSEALHDNCCKRKTCGKHPDS